MLLPWPHSRPLAEQTMEPCTHHGPSKAHGKTPVECTTMMHSRFGHKNCTFEMALGPVWPFAIPKKSPPPQGTPLPTHTPETKHLSARMVHNLWLVTCLLLVAFGYTMNRC